MSTRILKRPAAYYSLLGFLLLWLSGQAAVPNVSPPTGITIRTKTSTAANLSLPASVSAIEPNKCYRLVSRLSGKVLGVESSSPNDGAQLRQNADGNQLSQGWQFTSDGAYYRISVLQNQKGIQVRNGSTAEDALLEQWTYWGGNYQQWTAQRNAEGYYSFINRNSGKAITVRNASLAEGAEISQQTPGTGQQQQWSIEERGCTAAPSNRPPVVVATSTSLTGTSPLSVTFTGNRSSDPDGDPITYQWDFGDGTFSTEANPVKVFTIQPGRQGIPQYSYSVKLTVSDNRGGIAISPILQVSLRSTAPTVQITNPVNSAKYALDKATSYTLAASVTNASSGLTYLWQVKLRHNNSEQLVSTTSGPNPVVSISPAGCGGEDFYYLIGLKVTDVTGTTGQDSVKIYPDCNSPRLTVTGLTASTATSGNSSRVLLRWTNPTLSFDDVLVVGKAGSGFTEIPLDPAYTANASFTGNGADLYGGKVLYQGTGNSLLVTELTAGQRYYFRVYARKDRGWSGGVEVSIVPTAANRPPVVVATSTSLTGTSPLSVTFTGNRSSDPDGDPITYQWNFGDGTFSTEANPVKIFTIRPGAQGIPQSSFSVRLTVSDDKGGIAIGPLLLVSLSNPSSASLEPGKCYRIQPRGSGLVLNVPAGAGNDGAKLQLNTDAGQPWQKWQFTADGAYYRISVLHNQKGIQVRNASTADDALLEQWTYWGGNYQQWTAQRNTEGYYSFINRNSGKAITVRNASLTEGAEISQQTPGTGQQQQWALTETACPTGGRMGVAEAGSTFSLWPNPANDHVMVDLSPARGQSVGLQLNDLLGRPLQQTQLERAPTEPYRVNTGQLPNGLYLLQLSPAGQLPTTLRVLIQR